MNIKERYPIIGEMDTPFYSNIAKMLAFTGQFI